MPPELRNGHFEVYLTFKIFYKYNQCSKVDKVTVGSFCTCRLAAWLFRKQASGAEKTGTGYKRT